MKTAFIVLFVFAICIGILTIKSKNSDKIKDNGAQTPGIVTEIIQRGKLPFCKYTYTVSGVKYTKKQELPKYLVRSALHKEYTVHYEISNPKNAILKFSK